MGSDQKSVNTCIHRLELQVYTKSKITFEELKQRISQSQLIDSKIDFLKEIAQYFDDVSLSEELIQQITLYLKDMYESEGRFYSKQKTRLRKEQDQIQQRISKMYDDRYDGKIDEVFFEKKLKEYKDREFAMLQEMEGHAKGDESFHITANMVLSLARRAREIFESSEVEEKRQLLNFVFQNLELKDKKLSIHYREPFKMIKDTSRMEKCPGMCR